MGSSNIKQQEVARQQRGAHLPQTRDSDMQHGRTDQEAVPQLFDLAASRESTSGLTPMQKTRSWDYLIK